MTKTTYAALATIIIFIIASATPLLAQKAELYDVLFADRDKQLKDFKSQFADLLAPTFYANAIDKYAKVKDEFKKGRDAAEVRKRLTEVDEAFKKIEMTLWTGRNTFKEVLKAREDALNASASEFALVDFNAAEDLLRSAGEAEEVGDSDGAREKAAKATARYRDSELNAIKKSVMTPARDAFQEAEKAQAEKYAPKTFEKAKTLYQLAEQILINNRYNVNDASAKAEESIYEAHHALQMEKYLKAKKYTTEDIILDYEQQIAKIAQEVNYDAQYDEDLSKTIQSITTSINSLKAEKKSLIEDLAAKEKELEQTQRENEEATTKMRQQLASLMAASQQKESAMQEELARKQKELEIKQAQEAKLAKVRDMFSSSEASVLLEGNRLIIRLFSLSFPIGKATILPEYFDVLSRVQRAIREYPDAKISIEGHTDSSGDERYNERLSTKRAEAVRDYLATNMGLDAANIEAIGYGESRPIATNDTEEGRAQNRRIDVTLTIE